MLKKCLKSLLKEKASLNNYKSINIGNHNTATPHVNSFTTISSYNY